MQESEWKTQLPGLLGPHSRVLLLVGESGSGKSAWLTQQLGQLTSPIRAAGILSPLRESDGKRCLLRLSTRETRCHQLNDLEPPDQVSREMRRRQERAVLDTPGAHKNCSYEVAASEHDDGVGTVRAGPYVFDAQMFKWAREELVQATDVDWIVIDEIGPLELKRGAGLEPAVSECLRLRHSLHKNAKFVLIVRPSLVQLLMSRYALHMDECVLYMLSGSDQQPRAISLEQHMKASLVDFYNQDADSRAERTMARWKIDQRDNFVAAMPVHGSIMELGSGPGRDGSFFQSLGFQVTCLDMSPEMVRRCQEAGLAAHVHDMTRPIDAADASLDAVYAMNSLLHVPKCRHHDVLSEIRRVLKSSGVFFLGQYGGSDFEGFWQQDPTGANRFFSFYSDATLQEIIGMYFKIVQYDTIDLSKYDFQSILCQQQS